MNSSRAVGTTSTGSAAVGTTLEESLRSVFNKKIGSWNEGKFRGV